MTNYDPVDLTAVDESEENPPIARSLKQPERTLSVRVPVDLLDQLVALSIVDEGTLADQLRNGLRVYVAQRKAEPTFEHDLEAARDRRLAELASLRSPSEHDTPR